MSVPEMRFPFQRPVSPGGNWPPISGVPLDEPPPSDSGTAAVSQEFAELYVAEVGN